MKILKIKIKEGIIFSLFHFVGHLIDFFSLGTYSHSGGRIDSGTVYEVYDEPESMGGTLTVKFYPGMRVIQFESSSGDEEILTGLEKLAKEKEWPIQSIEKINWD